MRQTLAESRAGIPSPLRDASGSSQDPGKGHQALRPKPNGRPGASLSRCLGVSGLPHALLDASKDVPTRKEGAIPGPLPMAPHF